MTNAWITHVKQFASKHHLKYGDALKHPQCKTTYHKIKGGMIPQRPDGRPSGRRGRRPQMTVEEPPVHAEVIARPPARRGRQTQMQVEEPPVHAEVTISAIPEVQIATSTEQMENDAMNIMGQIRNLQARIRSLAVRLDQNPRNLNIVSILEALQESERSLLAEVHEIISILNPAHEPVARLIPTVHVPVSNRTGEGIYRRKKQRGRR